MRKIAITGGICAGKSSVCRFIRELGGLVISADEEARKAFLPTSPTYSAILDLFQIEPSELSFPFVADQIFNDSILRQKLEAITHPFIEQSMLKKESSILTEETKIIFYEIPLLFEKNLMSRFDLIILVQVSHSLQMQRLMHRNQITKKEALKRIEAQSPQDLKLKKSHFVIENNSTLEELQNSVNIILQKIDDNDRI